LCYYPFSVRNLNDLRKKRQNALIITAHPDDESIFMGGTIAEFKKWNWRILCVTDCDEKHNMRRRKELLSVCRIYKRHNNKIEPFMLGVTKKNGRFSKAEITGKIRNFLRKTGSPDIVFTHNKMGEYGHKTHRLIHRAVLDIGFRRVYGFSYRKSGEGYCKGLESVRLSDQSLSIKKRAIRIYLEGSQKTNLSRLKRIVDNALNSIIEAFYRCYYVS
jgi:LmbE family N-acetylglucosaminyl deacetylase